MPTMQLRSERTLALAAAMGRPGSSVAYDVIYIATWGADGVYAFQPNSTRMRPR